MERPELLDPKLDLDQIWEKPGPQQHPRPLVPGAEKEWTERVRVRGRGSWVVLSPGRGCSLGTVQGEPQVLADTQP